MGDPSEGDGVALGRAVVAVARRAMESAVRTGRRAAALDALSETTDPAWDRPRGVFVTLESYPGDHLRGCIGYPLPGLPLREAVVRAAAGAALEDPRFPPVQPGELPTIRVEVSILSVPEPIPGPPELRARSVRVGRDGLVMESGGGSGLLLPQVAVEQGWDAESFLEGTCEKAGLPRGSWRRATTRVYRFQAEIFAEDRPGGPVRARPLAPP